MINESLCQFNEFDEFNFSLTFEINQTAIFFFNFLVNSNWIRLQMTQHIYMQYKNTNQTKSKSGCRTNQNMSTYSSQWK